MTITHLSDVLLYREAVRRYEELSDIFSEKDNYSHSRELLKEVSCFFVIKKLKYSGNLISCMFSVLAKVKTGWQALNDEFTYILAYGENRVGSVRNLILYLWHAL